MLQALRIADAAGNSEAALAAHPDVTHIFFLADGGGGGKQLAAALDAFQRLVDAAEAAGCRLQQTQFSAAQHQPGQSLAESAVLWVTKSAFWVTKSPFWASFRAA